VTFAHLKSIKNIYNLKIVFAVMFKKMYILKQMQYRDLCMQKYANI